MTGSMGVSRVCLFLHLSQTVRQSQGSEHGVHISGHISEHGLRPLSLSDVSQKPQHYALMPI